MPPAALRVSNLKKSYKDVIAVNGLDLEVFPGECFGLLGPNGAGKTTTFYMIVGLTPPDAGRVLVNGEDVSDVPMYLRARNFGISYLPQEPSVFRKLTVEEVASYCRLIVFAGGGTTWKQLGITTFALLNHPEQLEAGADDGPAVRAVLVDAESTECGHGTAT